MQLSSPPATIDALLGIGVAIIHEGSYTGDGSANRGIPHMLGVIPKLVILQNDSNATLYLLSRDSVVNVLDPAASTSYAQTVMDDTNFYVSSISGNYNLTVFKYVAFS